MRKVLVLVEVDDERAIAEDMGTLDYMEREFGWLEESGIFDLNARVLDDDDPQDIKALQMVDEIFNEY